MSKPRRAITRRPKGSDSTPNLNRNDQGVSLDEGKNNAKLSIPGALQCIHHEWAKYEVERSKWAVDKAELDAKVAFLGGQHKGQERLVHDLVCRIKMLEYSLKEERVKYHRLKYGGEAEPVAPEPVAGLPVQEESDGEDFLPAQDWKHGRELLRQYLNEIGYTEVMVNVSSYRVNSLLRLYDNPQNRGCVDGPAKEDVAAESPRPETIPQFEFPPEDEGGEEGEAKEGEQTRMPWVETWPTEAAIRQLGDLAYLNVASVSERSDYMIWRIKYMLRGHYDSVRSLAFHPTAPMLATASEDHTIDLWRLEDGSGSKLCDDLEAAYTFRGHTGPVMCVAISPNGKWVFSGGLDGTLLCWEFPGDLQLKESGANNMTVRLEGHTDIVWGLSHQLYGGRTTVLSCSSDGSVKLWAPEESLKSLSTFCSQDGECPTSVDFSRAEPNHMVTSYDTGECVLYDIEYGKPVVWLETPGDRGTAPRVNRVISHPVFPATVTAGEDGCVRFYDDSTGRLVHTTTGHKDSVSSVAIDRHGMYMLTGSHDRTVCVWDVRGKNRIQQIHAHGNKFRESVFDVAFHQTRPLIASAGADGYAQVFGPT